MGFKGLIDQLLSNFNPNPGAAVHTIQQDVINTGTLLEQQSTYMESLFNIFISIGLALALIYFMIDLMNIASTSEFTMEKMVKSFMKLLLAFLLVKNGYKFLIEIANIGVKMAEGVHVDVGSLAEGQVAASDFGTIWNYLVAIAGILPSIFLSLIISISSKIILYSRMIEIGIYLILSPIALSDAMNGGMKSNAVSFIKRFFALALQGVVIVLIMAIFGELSDSIEWGAGLDVFFGTLGVSGIVGLTASMSGGIGAVSSFITGLLTGGAFSASIGVFLCANIYMLIVYGTETIIMLSFLFKSKQIAMDIVGLG